MVRALHKQSSNVHTVKTHQNVSSVYKLTHSVHYCISLSVWIYRIKLHKTGYLDIVKQQALKRNLGWEGYTDGHFIVIDTNIEVYMCEELFLLTFCKIVFLFF